MKTESDVLIIGSGIAGLRLALELSPFAKVFILTKKELLHSNTRWAQGGSLQHGKMTTIGNHMWKIHWLLELGLCRREVVEFCGKTRKATCSELIELGVQLIKEDDNGSYSLHKEGGHSTHRILHSKDLTGAGIMRALTEKVKSDSNIHILENLDNIDLITKGWLARRNNELPPTPDRF